MGGFVAWDKGEAYDGSDSYGDAISLFFLARQVANASHWPDLNALILVVSDAKKEIGSTVGRNAQS